MRRLKAWRYKWQGYANGLTLTGSAVSAILLIGLRWLQGVLHKGRELLTPIPLLSQDPQPVFASKQAERDFYDQVWFSRIRSLTCKT